ncbi:hypothetical protein L0F63_004553 [Massospora cicadina]|nr:hypothetical protein L0F63_004553 [Massospora cicadina]
MKVSDGRKWPRIYPILTETTFTVVSFNANLFDTSTDNAAGEFQETRPSLEAIADRQPECEAGSSQPHSGSTDDATLVPDKDSSLDSILPFKISASSRFQASKTKPKAKPKLPCDKLNLQANVKPKKSGKPALKERAQGLRKVAKKTAPVTAVMKKEKDGFLITTTRSGRQSHRPLKLWENEKGPKPEVSIKYNFMTFGVTPSRNPRKRIRRVSLANQSLGIISPGILLPPKKATRAKLKALPKRPLKEIPAKVTSKKPAKTSKLTATLNDALQGKASDLFRVQTQLSDSFSTQSSASPDPRYEFSD